MVARCWWSCCCARKHKIIFEWVKLILRGKCCVGMSRGMIESQRLHLHLHPFAHLSLVITFRSPISLSCQKCLHARPKSNQTNRPLMDLIHKSEVRVISSQLITFATQTLTGRKRRNRKPAERNCSRAKAENCQNQEEELSRVEAGSLMCLVLPLSRRRDEKEFSSQRHFKAQDLFFTSNRSCLNNLPMIFDTLQFSSLSWAEEKMSQPTLENRVAGIFFPY